MENKFVVSMSPHIHEKEGIAGIMLDVIIALLPAVFAGIYYFGYRAAVVVLTAIASCVLFEYFYTRLMKKKNSVRDLSAVVTGILIGLNMPSTIPLWMVVVGSGFAILLVKQLYGGMGKNFMNPALAARCFMLIAWASAMTKFAVPFEGVDTISSATPLSVMKGVSEGTIPSLRDAFWGAIPGSIGETSVFALLIGFVYLLARRVISWKIPVTYILVFGVLTYFFGKNATDIPQFEYTLMQICTGGLVLGAVFMATDYTTTPTTPIGTYIFAAGCGIITFVLRKFGGYPEGVSFSILLMNILVPQIDKFTVPKKFGEVRKTE